MTLLRRYYEIPPTAGLPTKWRDWLPCHNDLALQVSQLFKLPPLQLTCSGTAALVIALTTLKRNAPERHYVIIPAYTCPLVALAIHHCGLKIKLCDLSSHSFDFDFGQLASLMDEQVLAVIPTHLGGRVADIARAVALAKPYNITIIEDAAQALGAQVGIYGDIVFYSLAAGKGLTLYEGGLLTSRHEQLHNQLEQTAKTIIPRDRKWELTRTLELFGYTLLYNPFGLYFAYGNPKRKSLKQHQLIEAVGDDFDFDLPLHKVSHFRQNVASNSVKRLPQFIQDTTQQALSRVNQLQQIRGLQVLTDNEGQQGTWPFMMVILPTGKIRDDILQALWAGPLGITRLFIHALSDYTYLESIVPKTSAPNAQNLANQMLTISNSLWLNDDQFQFICQIIEKHIA